MRNGDTAHLNGVELDARQFTSVSIMCKRRAIPMRARKIVSYLYSRNCMHIEDASVCIQKAGAIIKNGPKIVFISLYSLVASVRIKDPKL